MDNLSCTPSRASLVKRRAVCAGAKHYKKTAIISSTSAIFPHISLLTTKSFCIASDVNPSTLHCKANFWDIISQRWIFSWLEEMSCYDFEYAKLERLNISQLIQSAVIHTNGNVLTEKHDEHHSQVCNLLPMLPLTRVVCVLRIYLEISSC